MNIKTSKTRAVQVYATLRDQATFVKFKCSLYNVKASCPTEKKVSLFPKKGDFGRQTKKITKTPVQEITFEPFVFDFKVTSCH